MRSTKKTKSTKKTSLKNIRKENSKKDGLYIIEVADVDEHSKKYVIMGHSGKVYETLITNKPSCSCPDFKYRRKRCKHIYFILLKAMKVKADDTDNPEYTDDDIENMFNKIPPAMDHLYVNDYMHNKYEKAKKEAKNKGKVIVVEMKSTDDSCLICLDDLENGEELDYCKYSCGKPIHSLCFKMWTSKRPNCCIICKADWDIY